MTRRALSDRGGSWHAPAERCARGHGIKGSPAAQSAAAVRKTAMGVLIRSGWTIASLAVI